MKNELFEIITESYESGKITITDANDYLTFVEHADMSNVDNIDTLNDIVRVLQESPVRPVTDNNRINYWKQMINATRAKLIQKMKERNSEKDPARRDSLDNEVTKLRANLETYTKNINQIKDAQTGQAPKGVGLFGTMHTANLVKASTDFNTEELSGITVLEQKIDAILRKRI